MRVFKRDNSKRWYVDFSDHNDRRRRLAGFTHKQATRQLADTLEKLCAVRQTGRTPDRDLRRAIEALPGRITERLGEWGLLTEDTVAMAKPLHQHIEEWHEDLLRGNTQKHADQRKGRVERIVDAAGWQWWADINAIELERVLDQWEDDLKTRTLNFYRAAAKQFCKWMYEHRRASENPLRTVKRRTVTDEEKRRPLTAVECQKLISAAHSGPIVCGVEGPERALLYRLALETGLRYGELQTLKTGNLNLDADPPTVTVEAAYAKSDREDVLPLREDTAAVLKAHTRDKLPAAPVFPLTADKGAYMVRADLEAAGIPYRDDSGRKADFHALRHTFLTNLANSGVHPKTAQMLARHSNISLTMDRYTHSVLEKQSEAVGKLPAFEVRGPHITDSTRYEDGKYRCDCGHAFDCPNERKPDGAVKLHGPARILWLADSDEYP